MKGVRCWECVGLEPTRDGWYNLRIRIYWRQRERGGPESNLRLGIRRERFAQGDQFHRLRRLAPDLVQEIFQWWQQVQLVEAFPEAIAAGRERKDGAKEQPSHGYGVGAPLESAQTGRRVANEAADPYQQLIYGDSDHERSNPASTARSASAPSSAAPAGADVLPTALTPREAQAALIRSLLRTEQTRREAAAAEHREQIERENELQRAELAERERRMAQGL